MNEGSSWSCDRCNQSMTIAQIGSVATHTGNITASSHALELRKITPQRIERIECASSVLTLQLRRAMLKSFSTRSAQHYRKWPGDSLLSYGVGSDVECKMPNLTPSRSMRSMRGGFIFHNRGPSLKVHHGQCLTSMTKHDSGGSPPGAACDRAKPPHDRTQGSASGWRSRLSPYLPNGHFPRRPN
jgi:hypothetical protein